MGGSFDPPHYGHLAIAESFLGSGRVDQLWILVTPQPPHKPDQIDTPFSTRLEMTKIAFQNQPLISVHATEQQLSPPHYTIHSLRYLRAQHPGYQFLLCIGEDSFASFTSWYQYREILEIAELLVAQRPDSESEHQIPIEIEERAFFIDHRPVDISSTEIRRRIREGVAVDALLPDEVISVIAQKRLYRHDGLKR